MIFQTWERALVAEHTSLLFIRNVSMEPESSNTMTRAVLWFEEPRPGICGVNFEDKKERNQQNILIGFMTSGEARHGTSYNRRRTILASVHTALYVGGVSMLWQKSREKDSLTKGFIVNREKNIDSIYHSLFRKAAWDVVLGFSTEEKDTKKSAEQL